MADEKVFEGWAILELMGHRRLAGYVTEVEIAGHGMLRLDIPAGPLGDIPEELQDTRPTDLAATQFYSPAALYCLTPTSERIARAMRARPHPVQRWELEPPREETGIPDDELERMIPDDLDDGPDLHTDAEWEELQR